MAHDKLQAKPGPSGPELPIACSLDATQMRERGLLLHRIAAAGMTSAERVGDALELRFSATREMRRDLEQFVELERVCCPFLSFSFDTEGDATVLSISAPENAAPILDAMYFAATTREPSLLVD